METKDSIEVTFAVTPAEAEVAFDDCSALIAKHAGSALRAQGKQLRLLCRLALGYAFVLIFTAYGMSLPVAIVAAIPCSGVVLSAMVDLAKQIKFRSARVNFVDMTASTEDALVEQLARVDADGLFKQSSNMRTTFFWHYVRVIALTKTNIIFVMDPYHIPNVSYIPIRAFNPPAEAQAFVDMARRYQASVVSKSETEA